MLNESLYGMGVGLILGLTGAGGGVLAVPALVLGIGLSPVESIPISLLAVASAAWIGCFAGLRKGLVRYKAALLMSLIGVACAPVGIWLSHRLPVEILMTMFCIVLLLAAVRMASQAMSSEPQKLGVDILQKDCMINQSTGKFNWNLRCLINFSAVGGISGLFSGMLGVGGGFLIVPGIRQISNLNMHGTVATSLAVISMIASSTTAGILISGREISEQGWYFIVTCIIGMLSSRFLAPFVPARILQLLFSIISVVVALILFGKTTAPYLQSLNLDLFVCYENLCKNIFRYIDLDF